MFLKTKSMPCQIFLLLLMKRHQKKKMWFQLESPVAQRSARVNKNSYKKPFTFPSYKIYLWGILPGKSPAETKDCLARMSWLGNIQNMWSVRDPRSHSQGLCSGMPQPLLPFLLPMTFTKWITHTHTLSDRSGWSLWKTWEKVSVVLIFSFLVRVL